MDSKLTGRDMLRNTAEIKLARAYAPKLKARPAEELLHELQVHQIELEMQNEKLRQSGVELEKSRDRYVDLFDFSPVGYLTLNHKGMIDEINLTGAALLKVKRNKLPYHRFASFVAMEDRDRWHRHFLSVLKHDSSLSCELALQHDNRPLFYAQLDCLCLKNDGENSVVRIALTDITERKQQETSLKESEERFRTLVETAPTTILVLGLNGEIIDLNNAAEKLYGCKKAEVLGKNYYELFLPEEIREEIAEDAHKVLAGKPTYGFENKVVTTNGRELYFSWNVDRMLDSRGNPIGIIAVGQDITARKQAEATLRESEERLYTTLETSMDAIVQMDADGIIIGWNSMMEKIFGWTRAEAIGRLLYETIIPPQHHEANEQGIKHFLLPGEGPSLNKRIEVVGMHRFGHVFPMELTVIPMKMGGKCEFSVFIRDITQKKETDILIWRQANFDQLTGSPNRHMFRDRMEQEIKKAKRAGRPVALMFIDIDRFKEINDTLGHDMGDLLLIEAARRINECVRATDIVARLGGDEFTVLVTEFDDVGSVERIATSITQKISAPFRLKEEMGYVSASVGITLYPNDAETTENLYRNAEQAMYSAKSLGRNRHSYFTATMQEAAQTRLKLVNDLRVAVAGNQFLVYFQPIVELATGNIHKAEALIRWQHPTLGMISPGQFIPLAEETGLIFEIGDWVFHESMNCAKRWRALYNPALQISVNKSPVQFYKDGDDHTAWLSHLKKLDLHGQCLAIEITEGLLLDSNNSISGALFTLRNAGIQVSIDDFGTGYSSLSYLKKFDIDYLKIDRSFISDLVSDPNDLTLSKAIILMAHELGIKVIAEGVETKEQRDLLVAAGCDYVQGYLYSRPVPADEFEELLKRENL